MLIAAALLLSLLASSEEASAQIALPVIIQGCVTSTDGLPISGAKVVVLDWSTFAYRVLVTDEDGFYSGVFPRGVAFTPHEYVVYVLHQNSEGVFDYVPAAYPSNPYERGSRICDSQNVSFSLHPGATVYLSGELWYILSREVSLWHTFEVVEAANQLRPNLGSQAILTFGQPPYRYPAAVRIPPLPDVRYLPEYLFNRSLVVVPAGMRVYVLVKAEFFNERTERMEIVGFAVDQGGSPFNLSQGEFVTVNLGAFSARFNVETLKTVIGSVENELSQAESQGFFVGAERQDLGSVSKRIEDSEPSLPPNNYDPSRDALREVRFIFLDAAYYQLQLLERRIADMYLLAESHSFFFPFFLAVFTVILAFFTFESNRRKLLMSLVLYPVMAAGLVYVYPGFMVLFDDEIPLLRPLFTDLIVPGSVLALGNMALAIGLVLFVFFVFPRVYKEPIVEGRTSLRSILSVIFSMGKRNVRRRKIRSLFSIASMTILVLGFTALTSFSTIYGIVKVGPTPANVETPGVLLQKFPGDQQSPLYPQEFFTALEAESLRDYGAAAYAPKAENIPKSMPVVSLRSESGKEADIYGVVGILPSLESRVTHIERFLVGGELTDNTARGLVFSRQLAERLGVGIGDKVSVANLSAGVATPLGEFSLVAYLDDGFFSLQDVNGRPYVPNRYRGGGLVATNQTETVLMGWRDALELGGLVGLSRLFAFVAGSESGIVDFANRMALRGYSSWAYEPTQVTRFYTGTTLEVRGFEQFIVPFIIVVLNVAMVMVTLMYERTREVYLLAMLGLNPAHIASLFLAESIVMALVGGGLGYFLGLGSYRLITFLGLAGQVGVREKLEWYWSVIGVLIAVAAAVSSTIRPAVRAAVVATPSLVRKVKMEESERREREKDLFRVYGARVFGMPIRVHVKEEPFFSSLILDALSELSGLHHERIEDISVDEEVAPDGTRTKRISFTYTFVSGQASYSTVNVLIAKKRPESDYYSLSLSSEPKVKGTPEFAVDQTVTLVKHLVMRWPEERTRMLGAKP
ncbi:MAG: FtsX-like permease family protein [Candidatus Bathyarchaeia archaeon]